MAFTTLLPYAMTLLVLAVGIALLRPTKLDRREPPLIHPSIPLIGHAIGMLRHGNFYLKNLACVLLSTPYLTPHTIDCPSAKEYL